MSSVYLSEKMIVGVIVFLTVYLSFPYLLTTGNPRLYLSLVTVISHAIAHQILAPYILSILAPKTATMKM